METNVYGLQFDEAWEVFMEMRPLGVKTDIFTYNVLINARSHKKSVSTAFELVEIMQKEGVSPYLIIYNSLIKVCSNSYLLLLAEEPI